MIYFTADNHFGHKNILNFCRRPFADVQEMQEKMISAINTRVGEKDELWFIGDFGLHLKEDNTKELLKRLVCKHTRLIIGNHDEKHNQRCFEQIYQAHVVKDNHRSFYLSHYPLRSWRQDFQLHGHEHGTMKAMVGQLDVGVDGPTGMNSRDIPFGTPWSLEEVVEYVQRRDKAYLVKDACRQRHGDRLVVGGYGSVSGRTTIDQPNFAELSRDDAGDGV